MGANRGHPGHGANRRENEKIHDEIYRAHAGGARSRQMMIAVARGTVMASHDLAHTEQRKGKQPNENDPYHRRL